MTQLAITHGESSRTRDTASSSRVDHGEATVFISYSRHDTAFVDRLDAELQARSVKTLVDRAAIEVGENWFDRLKDLISRAETVIFVISPESVQSKVCAEEVAYGRHLGKRFIPVVARRVETPSVPQALSELNYVYLDDEATYHGNVDRLVTAIRTDLAWIRTHADLGRAADEWSRAGRPRGLLLGAARLRAAESWIAHRPANAPLPTDDTRALVAASRRLARQWRNGLVGALALGLVVALGLAALAYLQRQEAVVARAEAERQEGLALERALDARRSAEEAERQADVARSRETEARHQEQEAIRQRNAALVTQSLFLADQSQQRTQAGDAGTGMLLALEALAPRGDPDRPYVPEAELALTTALRELRELRFWPSAVAISPDGRKVLILERGQVAIHNLADDEEIWLNSLEARNVQIASFSPDAETIALKDGRGSIILWTPRSQDVRHLTDLEDGRWVVDMEFSQDGRWLHLQSLTGKIALDVGTGLPLFGNSTNAKSVDICGNERRLAAKVGTQLLIGQRGALKPVRDLRLSADIFRIACSPDDRLVAIDTGTSIMVVDAIGGRKLAVLESSGNAITFSPDGEQLGFGSDDGTVKVWSWREKRLQTMSNRHLAEDGSGVAGLAFSPDGTRLVSTARDSTARVWSVAAGQQLMVLHHGDVRKAKFAGDGTRLFTMGGDGARLWNVGPKPGHRALVGASGFSSATSLAPDGRSAAVLQASEGFVRVYDTASGAMKFQLKPHKGNFFDVRYSPDGLFMLTNSRTSGLELWRGDREELVEALEFSGGQPVGFRFSSNGRYLVAWSDTSVRIWNVSDRTLVWMLNLASAGLIKPSGDASYSLTFEISSDGDYLFASRPEVRLWHVPSKSEVRPLSDGRLLSGALTKGNQLVTLTSEGLEVRDLKKPRIVMRQAQRRIPRDATLLSGEDGSWIAIRTAEAATIVDIATLEPVASGAMRLEWLRADQKRGLSHADRQYFLIDLLSAKPVDRMGSRGRICCVTMADGGRLGLVNYNRSDDGPPGPEIWTTFQSTDQAIAAGRSVSPRCLSRAQRESAFLPPEMPGWCREFGKPVPKSE